MIHRKHHAEQMSGLIRVASRDAAIQIVEHAKQTNAHVIIEQDSQIIRLIAHGVSQELQRLLTKTLWFVNLQSFGWAKPKLKLASI